MQVFFFLGTYNNISKWFTVIECTHVRYTALLFVKGLGGKGKKEGPENSDGNEGGSDDDEEDIDINSIRKGNLKSMIEIVKKLVNKTTGPFSPGVEPEDLGVLYVS